MYHNQNTQSRFSGIFDKSEMMNTQQPRSAHPEPSNRTLNFVQHQDMPTTIGGTSHQSFVQSYNLPTCAGNQLKPFERKQPIKSSHGNQHISRAASITPSICNYDVHNTKPKKQKMDVCQDTQPLNSSGDSLNNKAGLFNKSPQTLTLKMLDNQGDLQDLDFDSDAGEYNSQVIHQQKEIVSNSLIGNVRRSSRISQKQKSKTLAQKTINSYLKNFEYNEDIGNDISFDKIYNHENKYDKMKKNTSFLNLNELNQQHQNNVNQSAFQPLHSNTQFGEYYNQSTNNQLYNSGYQTFYHQNVQKHDNSQQHPLNPELRKSPSPINFFGMNTKQSNINITKNNAQTSQVDFNRDLHQNTNLNKRKYDNFIAPQQKNVPQASTNKRAQKVTSKAKATPKIFINDASSSNQSGIGLITQEKYESLKAANPPPGQKRRGRKRERDDYYFLKAVKKIEEIRIKLKTAKADGLSVKDRQRLRNQVSAQQSRIKKKEEVMFLNRAVNLKDDKFTDLIEVMSRKLKPKDLIEIFTEVRELWNEQDENKQLPNQFDIGFQQVQPYRQAYLKPMTRAGSRNLLKNLDMEKVNSTNSKISDNQYNKYDSMQIAESSAFHEISTKFRTTLVENFTTKQQELDQFIQNDEKIYDEDDDE